MHDIPAERIAAAIFSEPLVFRRDGSLAPIDPARVGDIWRIATGATRALAPTRIAA